MPAVFRSGDGAGGKKSLRRPRDRAVAGRIVLRPFVQSNEQKNDTKNGTEKSSSRACITAMNTHRVPQ